MKADERRRQKDFVSLFDQGSGHEQRESRGGAHAENWRALFDLGSVKQSKSSGGDDDDCHAADAAAAAADDDDDDDDVAACAAAQRLNPNERPNRILNRD